MEAIPMTTGEKIAELRKKKGITQEQLSEMLNVSRQSVSRWEMDAAFPETEKLIKLSRLLDCSIDFLLSEAPFPGQHRKLTVSVHDCYRFIRESTCFFLATSVKDRPNLRPMGMIYCDHENLFIATDRRKTVYAELTENPNIALASYNIHANKWLRITGTAHPESSLSIREEMMNLYPMIAQEFCRKDEIYLAVFRINMESVNL